MGRRWGIVTVVVGLMLGLSPALAGAQEVPPCINYSHREEAGRIEVDLRFDPTTGTFSTLTMWWFIDDVEAAPGVYQWNHLVNGRATSSPNITAKNDQLHTSLKMVDRFAGVQWRWGDIYTFQATHYSPATTTTYVAATNQCRITPRI